MENLQKYTTEEDRRTEKNGKGYKVHLFIHVFDKYVVWIRNGQDIHRAIQVRNNNSKHIERVVFDKEDVTKICSNLIPIDQMYPEIPSEITEAQWSKDGSMKRKIDNLVFKAKQYRSKTGFGIISFRNYVEMRKARADSAIRVDFSN